MDRYVVTKSFMDRLNRKYYGVGSIYESNDPERAAQLERSGFIAPENTEIASKAMEEAKNIQQNNQSNTEAKTVMNGKVIPISQAQQEQMQAETNAAQSGIQTHHSNHSEAVQAGQVAKQSKSMKQATEKTIRESEVQSGQAANASGSSTSNYVGSGMQQGYEGTATPGTTAAQMQAEEAANTAQAAAEAKAKSKAKKEQ